MTKRKLNYRFHNPNPVEVTADYILKVMIEANTEKVEKILQENMEIRNEKKSYHRDTNNKKRIYNMFACAMTKYQIKLVIESYRLVIEFSHKLLRRTEKYDLYR